MIKSIDIIERVSSKTGNTYRALQITFINGYQKIVLCDSAELFMIEQLKKSIEAK